MCLLTGSVRDRVLTEETFWELSHEYCDGVTLEYDDKGKGPRTGASLALSMLASTSISYCRFGPGDAKD